VPQPGAAAGFEAVMNGVLASGSKTSDGTAQQAPDGGAQGKPAADGPRTVTRADKPEASKVAKDTVDAADAASAAGLPDPAGATGAVAAVAGGLAMAGVATGDTAPQGSGVAVPIMPAGNTQATPAGTRVGAAVSAALPLGSPGQSSTQPGPIPNSPQPTGNLPTDPQPAAALPINPLPAALPTRPLPGKPSSNQPAAAPPTGPLPAAARPTSPLPVGLERGVNPTAARSRESGTAVVLPAGRPSTQQDPQRILRQDAPIAAAPGLPAGIQAGVPVVVQAGSPLQQAPLGMATPTPQADPAKLLPQVSGPLFSLASAAPGAHVMTLKLSPEDLGPLTVRAHIEGAGVRIELFAPGDAGREAVRSILPELRRDLGESGFGASLHLSEHNAPADAGGGGSDPRDRRPMESPAFPRGSDGEPVRLPRTAVVLPRSSTSSLDILV
jgi:hypothetical protein